MATPQSSTVSADDAWRQALRECEQEVPSDLLPRIQQRATAEYIDEYVKQRQNIEKGSKIRGLLGDASKVVPYFKQYQSALDLIAQGAPSPCCLIWGTVRFALTVGVLASDLERKGR